MGVSPVRINEKCASDGRDARATSEIGFVKQSLEQVPLTSRSHSHQGGAASSRPGRGSGFQPDQALNIPAKALGRIFRPTDLIGMPIPQKCSACQRVCCRGCTRLPASISSIDGQTFGLEVRLETRPTTRAAGPRAAGSRPPWCLVPDAWCLVPDVWCLMSHSQCRTRHFPQADLFRLTFSFASGRRSSIALASIKYSTPSLF
jgi:hypothetical protein